MIKTMTISVLCSLFFGSCLIKNDTALKTNEKDSALLLTASEILKKTHEKAGGEFWSKPQSLSLFGRALFFKDGDTLKNEKHNMWRVFETTKSNAHKANGKVRIESYRKNKPILLLTFDGENTYDLNGKQEKSEADKRWSSNFGYGVIRHAFDEGYRLDRLEDSYVKNEKTYQIKIIDPNQGETKFDITQKDYKIVRVGFDTPQGWHERIYSQFFTKADYNWLQSGLVELYYDGKKSSDVIWTDFEINKQLPDSLFILK